MKQIFKNEYVRAALWFSVLIVIFLFPVVIGVQSLFEAYPALYNSHNFIPPQIKTAWVIDGATNVRVQVPLAMEVRRLIWQGTVPLWTPYVGAGSQLIGVAVVSLYHPLRLLMFTLFSGIRVFDFYFLLRYLIAGFGVFIFLRALKLSQRSAMLGGIAYMFSGYFVLYQTYWFLDIDAILPYVLWAFEKYFRETSARNIALAGFFISLTILGSHPQVSLIVALVYSSYFIWKIFAFGEIKNWNKHLAMFAIMAAVGALIALPYIVDFTTAWIQGVSIYDPILFPIGSAVPSRGLDHLSPIYLLHFWCPPSIFPELAISGSLYDQFIKIIPYFGMTAIFLALLTLFIRRKNKVIYFFWGFIALAMLKLFGFPLVNWIALLPILNVVGWHKLYGPISLAIAVLAAFGYEAIQNKSEVNQKGFFMTLISLPLIFGATIIFTPQAFFKSYTPDFKFLTRRPETINLISRLLAKLPLGLQHFGWSFISDGRYFVYFILAVSIFFGILATSFIWLSLKRSDNKIYAGALFFLLIFELWVYMPKIRDGFKYFNPYIAPPFVTFLQEKSNSDVFRVIATDLTFSPDMGAAFRIQQFPLISAIFPQRFYYFLPDTIAKNASNQFQLFPQDVAATPMSFFDAANLKYLITESDIKLPAPAFKLVYNKDLKIYENTEVLPRAYAVFNKITAGSIGEARNDFYSPNFDWRHNVVIEDSAKINLSDYGKVQLKSDVKITEYKADEVIVSANLEKAGILVLSDTFYDGWHAYLDDKEVPIYPANVLFRGVYVPAGNHTVRFAYRPFWFWPSVGISLAALFSCLFIIFARKKRI